MAFIWTPFVPILINLKAKNGWGKKNKGMRSYKGTALYHYNKDLTHYEYASNSSENVFPPASDTNK